MKGGKESSLLPSLGKGGMVAILGVGLLPPVQGNQCWESKAGGLKVVFEGQPWEENNRHLERFQCWHLQYCSSYRCVLLL